MKADDAPIVLFDGICNLCNASVQLILKYEKKAIFKFGTLQSEKVRKIVKDYSSEKLSDSVLLIQSGKLYQKSDAALKIARELRYFWPLYYLIYIPRFLRDPIYQLIARNRYKWFGKQEHCMIPSKPLQQRFI